MAGLLGWFALIFGAMFVLSWIPGIGGLFRGFWGFWITALLVGAVGSVVTKKLVERKRLAAKRRELANVESGHNQGKLGALLLAHGRARAALAPLQRAVDEEPQSPEWRYRLGLARLATGDVRGATQALASAAAIDEEYAYGDLQLRRAEAHARLGELDVARAALDTFDRNHGPSPESAYRRGLVERAAGRRDLAAQSFVHVAVLAERGAQFQRGKNRKWQFLAAMRRVI
ncbi:MAG: tetratricopeptide repeat protein [Planctomycetes bacterium]|nr:tetratricopeptide repeat protein [Planctomycetota bacterium]